MTYTTEEWALLSDAQRGPCDEWPLGCYSTGYGQSGRAAEREFGTRLTHVQAWIREHGPIPDGLFVLHHCDNRPCQNPQHLFLGTHGDNMRDRDRKKRGPCSSKETCPKGHPYDRVDPKTGWRKCSICRSEQMRQYYVRQKVTNHG